MKWRERLFFRYRTLAINQIVSIYLSFLLMLPITGEAISPLMSSAKSIDYILMMLMRMEVVKARRHCLVVALFQRKRMVAGEGKFFSAGQREEKTPGVYKRTGKETIQPMAFYVEQANYEPIFPIDKIAGGVVKNRFGLRFDQALKRALATAR